MIENGKPLQRSFFERNTVTVARELVGKILVCGKCSGRIVETEAYLGENDLASHASRKSARSKGNIMFGQAGRAYVYFTYGSYWMFNVVTEKEGIGGAVLIRAIEPLQGLALMKKRRNTDNIFNMCSGPGKLCQALSINSSFHGADVAKPGKLFFLESNHVPQIISSSRIGITKGTEHMFRFTEKNSKFISKKI